MLGIGVLGEGEVEQTSNDGDRGETPRSERHGGSRVTISRLQRYISFCHTLK